MLNYLLKVPIQLERGRIWTRTQLCLVDSKAHDLSTILCGFAKLQTLWFSDVSPTDLLITLILLSICISFSDIQAFERPLQHFQYIHLTCSHSSKDSLPIRSFFKETIPESSMSEFSNHCAFLTLRRYITILQWLQCLEQLWKSIISIILSLWEPY